MSADQLAQKVAEMQAHRDTLEKKQQHLERQAQLIAKQALERNKKGDKKGERSMRRIFNGVAGAY